MKKTGFYGYVYDFSGDYDAIGVDDKLFTHKYLMENNGIKNWYKIMFGFIKKKFFTAMMNSNKSSFYPYSILVNKCSDSCNNINNPYAKLCVPDVIKDINFKVFNLMSRTNEARQIK